MEQKTELKNQGKPAGKPQATVKKAESGKQKIYYISDAAKQVCVESHVLRYWEEELELPVKRNKLGHRYYTLEDVNRLRRIKQMKEDGFQLKAIRRALKQDEESTEGQSLPIEIAAVSENGVMTPTAFSDKEAKSYRLQLLLKNLMVEAIKEGNSDFCEEIKESILKELDYQFRAQEEREEQKENERIRREEEHYKKIDEMLRERAEKKEKRKKRSFF